jgi:hypothetical protein
MTVPTPARAQNTVFEQKKAEYLATEGSKFRYFHERTWAWLEKLKLGQIDPSTYRIKDVDNVEKPILDVLHNVIRCWGTMWTQEGWSPYDTAWRFGEWYTSVTLVWILLKYSDVIYPADKEFLVTLYNNYIRERDFSAGSENSRLNEMVGRYLWAQYHKDAQVQWSYNPPPNTNIREFEWAGKTYVPGNVYSTYELSRDWLFLQMREWVNGGNAELDSPCYTWLFILSFTAVYEHTQDPVMKQKAKMTLDFLHLESVADFSANQWGGALGRTYTNVIYGGDSRYYWDLFWNTIPSSHEPSMAVLVSSYRLPDIIYDIGDLSDEPDNYYHINMEYNINIVNAPGTGKWNYVTKFYNLGGRIGSGWQLNIKSTDANWNPQRPGVPFRMWINGFGSTAEEISNPVSYEAYSTMGNFGYQYNNIMFVRGAVLHAAIGGNQWDEYEKIDPWEFFKEGRTMVAAQTRKFEEYTSGMEVAIEGVDYTSFAAFKQAVLSYARVDNYNYTSTRGDMVTYSKLPSGDYSSFVKKKGETAFTAVWPFPFPRIQTQDWRGQWMIRWPSSGRLMLSKHGRQVVYDFDNWTITESAAGLDTQPPAVPAGVMVKNK